MGCKCVEVMNVAELRDRIIAFIDKPQAMARAARVNSAWHEEAIRHLWRGAITGDWFVDAFFRYWETPCLEVLSDLARKPDRFHHYLLHTKHLTLWWEAWSTDQWAIPEATLWTPLSYTSHDIRFLRPRDMQIEQPIRHLLKPNLTGLELGQNQRTAQSMQDIKVSQLSRRIQRGLHLSRWKSDYCPCAVRISAHVYRRLLRTSAGYNSRSL